MRNRNHIALLLFLVLWQCIFGMAAAAHSGSTDWGHHVVVPTRMMGVHLDEELHIAKILVSSEDQELRVAVDFASHDLVVSNVPNRGRAGSTGSSDPKDWSPSYSTMGTHSSDVIRLGGRRYRVPIRYDQNAAALFGCPSCHGILGLGPGSPIWMRWQSATFSAGSVTLGRSLPPVAGDGRVRIGCAPLHNDDLCVSEATVYGQQYQVRFRFRSAFTIVPNAVYDEYVGKRSVGATAVADWPVLRLDFPSAEWPVDPRNATLRIRPESLLGDSMRGGAPILLLKRHPDPDSQVIILGRTAWRSLMMYREFTLGRAAIASHHSNKRFPDWAVITGVVVIVLLVRWWMTRDSLFYESIDPSRLAMRSLRVPLQAGRRFLNVGMPTNRRMRAWIENRRTAAAVLNTMSRAVGVTKAGQYPGEWGIYPDRLVIELVAIAGAITFLYVPVISRTMQRGHLEFWVFMQVITHASAAWLLLSWAIRIIGQADLFGVLTFRRRRRRKPSAASAAGRPPKTYGIFRLGLICQATVNILLCSMLVMLASLTRADSLGTIIMALATSLLAGNVMYHLMAAIIHAVRFDYRYAIGVRGDVVWVFWIIYCFLVYVTTGVFVSAFVLIPMMRLQVVWAGPTHFVAASFTVFIVGLLFAFWLANNEAERMADWIKRQLPKKPTSGSV